MGLAAHGRVDVAGVCTSGGEVVDVRIEDNVFRCVVEGCPVTSTHEAILNHHRNALVHLGDLLEYPIEVSVDPVRSIDSETSSRSETSEVVGSFVDWCDRESVNVAALLDEVKNTIDSLEGVVKVCRVLEPGLVEECLADVEVVYTTGKRVETDDN